MTRDQCHRWALCIVMPQVVVISEELDRTDGGLRSLCHDRIEQDCSTDWERMERTFEHYKQCNLQRLGLECF